MKLQVATLLAAGFALAGCAHTHPGPPQTAVWRGNDTGNTLKSENDCKLDVDIEVHSLASDNSLSIHARNSTDHALFFKPLDAKIEFQGGKVEIPSWAAAAGKYEIPAAGEIQHRFILPPGSGFENHQLLQITLPIQDAAGTDICDIHTTLVKGAPPERVTVSVRPPSSSWTTFDISGGVGLPLARSSNLTGLGGSAPTIELMGTDFLSESSGISLLLGMEGSSGKLGSAALQAPAGLDSLTGSLLEAFFALDYTYRAHFGRRWAASYSLGPGGYFFNLSGSNYNDIQCQYYDNCNSTSENFGSAVRFMFSQQLAVDYRFSASPEASASETGVGLALYDFWIPSGSWGPVAVSGNSFGAVLFFITGW